MNVSFVIYKRSVILRDNTLEIYDIGFVETSQQYDLITFAVMNYLWLEGFLENHNVMIDNVYVFNGAGKQVFREDCQI